MKNFLWITGHHTSCYLTLIIYDFDLILLSQIIIDLILSNEVFPLG